MTLTRYQLSGGASSGGSSTPVTSAVPSYAGTRTRAWEAPVGVYGRTSAGMRGLRAKLGAAAAQTGLCRIALCGDSVTAGYGVQPGRNDAGTMLRNSLRDAWYRVGGLVYAYNNTTTDSRWTWSGFSVSGQLSQPYITATSGATATFTSDVPGTIVEILTTSESARFSYSIDGGAPVTIPAAAGSDQMQLIRVTGLPDTPHKIVFTAAGSGNSSLVAAGVLPTAGVAIVNGGMTSARTSDWLGDWWQGISVLLATQPDVMIIELGGNDAHNLVSPATMAANLNVLIDVAADAGVAVMLVASHYGDTTQWPNLANWNAFLSAIYDVADQQGVPLLDLADRFGPYAESSALGLISSDGLHPTAAGYATKARAWADLLMVPVAAPQPVVVGSAVRAYALSAGQTLASGSPAPINLTHVEFNDDPSLFTVNLADNLLSVTRSGKYLVQWELKFDGGNTGQRFASFARLPDGTTFRESGFTGTSGSTSGATPVRLTAGETYCLAGYVDGGATVAVASDAPRATGLSLTYLGV